MKGWAALMCFIAAVMVCDASSMDEILKDIQKQLGRLSNENAEMKGQVS
jgi:hypothetical protein